jgi:hypothetical protein
MQPLAAQQAAAAAASGVPQQWAALAGAQALALTALAGEMKHLCGVLALLVLLLAVHSVLPESAACAKNSFVPSVLPTVPSGLPVSIPPCRQGREAG